MGTMMLWNALLYVLIEARHRKTGPEVDQLWKLMGMVVSKYAEMSKPNTGVVYDALRKWLLEAWEEHCAAVKAEGSPGAASAGLHRCLSTPPSSFQGVSGHPESPNRLE